MDLVDIVDERGSVVGKAERNEAHAKHLLHQSVHVMVLNSKGQVLLHLRKATKKQYPLHWNCSAAGHVDTGETADDAATRELREEIGIDADLAFAGKFLIDDAIEHEVAYVYFARSDGPFTFEECEMERAEFFDLKLLTQEVGGMRMTPHLRNALKLLFEHEAHLKND